jgi:dolichol-phosphate mannosyltransferase
MPSIVEARVSHRTLGAVGNATCQVSLVIPIYNEIENIPPLVQSIYEVMARFGRSFEVIAIDDGSTDGSDLKLLSCAAELENFKVISFARNFGQTAALMAGLDHACGEIVATLDADLQNDPEDIPNLIAKIDEGFDLCCGWRNRRQDAAIKRNFVSRVANWLISRLVGVKLHDYGCTLKAYRRSVISGMRLYGEMHRFIPIYASWLGARIIEVPVRHYARAHGRSNYGLERVAKVALDLVVISFMHRHMARPIHLFGGIGLLMLLISFAAFASMLYLKLFHAVSMISTPLPLFSSMFFLLGVVTVLLGLIAEILMRTYFESQGRPHYIVRNTANLGNVG